jgi:hypothetical protein
VLFGGLALGSEFVSALRVVHSDRSTTTTTSTCSAVGHRHASQNITQYSYTAAFLLFQSVLTDARHSIFFTERTREVEDTTVLALN